MGIRLVVIDDNPHLSWGERVYPANATFGQFLPAILDVQGPDGEAFVERIDHCVPLRVAQEPPRTLPLDPRIHVVGTAPFDGIGGYLRHAPGIVTRNARTLRPVIRAADLVWIKVPASNALLAAALARAAGVPRFGYVAGSAAEVAAGQDRGRVGGGLARLVGAAYDLVGRVAASGGDRVVVGADLDTDGIVTSLVEPDEIRDRSAETWPAEHGVLRLAWAGRVVDGKGLDEILAAVARLTQPASPSSADSLALDLRLVLLGHGRARPRLTGVASTLGIGDQVTWAGYIADRGSYLGELGAADLFVFPSPAEGFPKVILDAMAVGIPVLATPAGCLALLAAAGTMEPIESDAEAIASSIRALASRPAQAVDFRRLGTAFAAAHTRSAEATRLVARWQARWPDLGWA